MFDLTTFLTSLAGSGILSIGVASGLSRFLADRWMARLKSDLDKELEAYRDILERKRKRIEAELGHRTYVSKTQFDTEFNAVKDCFSALGKLRLSFNGLRSSVAWQPQDDEERAKALPIRLSIFKERYDAFIAISESTYPFIPEEIYKQFEICAKFAFLDVRYIGEESPISIQGDGETYEQKFQTAYFMAAKLVRQRFHQLSVVPD